MAEENTPIAGEVVLDVAVAGDTQKILWAVIPEKSHESLLELRDPQGWRTASVRFDGCVHYYRYYNVPEDGATRRPEDEPDYLHICDIDEEIARLQALKKTALDYFGADWPR